MQGVQPTQIGKYGVQRDHRDRGRDHHRAEHDCINHAPSRKANARKSIRDPNGTEYGAGDGRHFENDGIFQPKPPIRHPLEHADRFKNIDIIFPLRDLRPKARGNDRRLLRRHQAARNKHENGKTKHDRAVGEHCVQTYGKDPLPFLERNHFALSPS